MRHVPLIGALTGLLGGCALLARPPPAPAHPVAHTPYRTTHHYAAAHPHLTTGSAAAAGRLDQGAPPAPVAVVGLSQQEVRRLLGPPETEAGQGPSQTWTYRAEDCAVAIGFFFDVTRNGFFALSERSLAGGDTGACLGRIRDDNVS